MWTIETMPTQHGRVAVVTGANGGLGFEVALALARLGAVVVMAARDQDKGRAAQAAITAAVPDASLELYELDLADLASVRDCAEAIAAEHPRIDLLVNNAGVMGHLPRQLQHLSAAAGEDLLDGEHDRRSRPVVLGQCIGASPCSTRAGSCTRRPRVVTSAAIDRHRGVAPGTGRERVQRRGARGQATSASAVEGGDETVHG